MIITRPAPTDPPPRPDRPHRPPAAPLTPSPLVTAPHRRRRLAQHADLFGRPAARADPPGEPATVSGTTTSRPPRAAAHRRSPTPKTSKAIRVPLCPHLVRAGRGPASRPASSWVTFVVSDGHPFGRHRWCPTCRSGRRCPRAPGAGNGVLGWVSNSGDRSTSMTSELVSRPTASARRGGE